MEAWDGSVALGKMVCAFNVYALLCIRSRRFGMGAARMASGRSPSMDRIRTREARGGDVGVKVGVCVGASVAVAVAVWVGVSVKAAVRDGVGGLGEGTARLGS